MDWQVKYRIEWTDILGLDWKVEIEKDGYEGEPAIMQASGEPLIIEYLNNGDNIYKNPIKGSMANLNIESTNFQYIDLYSTEDMEYRMSVYYNTTLYWQGYIIPNNYIEAYNTPKFTVTISASDGLGYLKNYAFKYQTIDPDDTFYNGRMLESEIILNILGKIGITEYKEAINVYEESMNTGVADSPIDQLKLDADAFRDKYCYEVLENILKKYLAIMRQYGGIFYIYRPTEMVSSSVSGRYFIDVTNKSSITLTPLDQFISRTGNRTDICDVNGGTLMIYTPAKKITIYQDYINKESWIDNWSLKGNTIHPSLSSVDYWSRGGGCIPYTVNLIDNNESDGMIPSTHNNYPTLDKFMYQSFGVYITDTADVLGISFDYIIGNRSGGVHSAQVFYIKIKSDNSDHWLKAQSGDDACTWEDHLHYIVITEDVYMGSSGWKNFSRQIDGVPTAGTYTISLYASNSAQILVLIGYKNIKFFSTADEITIHKWKESYFPFIWIKHKERIYIDYAEVVRREYVETNAINGIEDEYYMMLGDVSDTTIDNVLEQFAGSLATITNNNRVDTITITGGSGTSDITCNGIIKTATWTTDEEGTAEQFVTDYGGSGGDYYLSGVQVSFTGANIIFTALAKGIEFEGNTSISGSISGDVIYTTPASSDLEYSTTWNTRGGSESKELLSIICDELAEQFSRPKQLLTLPIIEGKKYGNTPHVNILGNFQDSLNKIGENNRIFVFNSGSFNVRDREWNLDLIEII